jgi:hypothetical protein
LRAPQGPQSGSYFVPPLAAVEGLAAVPASGVGVGVGLVLLPMEPLPVDGVEGVDGEVVPGDDVAPVSSTFLPQAPSASKAVKARAVAAAVLDLDASMSVSFFRK